MNNQFVKAILSFLWSLPFLYIFLDMYFAIDMKLSDSTVKVLLVLSSICAFILVAIWFKEFREAKLITDAFKYTKNGDLEKLKKALFSVVNPAQYSENGTTLLEFAINQQANPSIVSYLLGRYCYVSKADYRGYNLSYTLFYLCAYYNYLSTDLINYLIQEGANVNFVDNTKGFDGLSILQVLVLRGDKSSVNILLENGADVNYFIDNLSLSTLMLAAKYVEDPIIIKTLIDHGASIDKSNSDGYNSLLFAAHYNPSAAVITTLVNSGAKLDIYNIKTPLMKYSEVTALMLASNYNNESVVKKLIQMGDDIYFKDTLGLNALFVAAAHNTDVDVIKALLMAGLSLENSRDQDGNIPLMAAAFLNSNPTVIKYLIDKTHNLKTTNHDGFTFIDYLKQNPNLTDDEKEVILNRWI